jgi:hypothetical protein
LNFGTFLLLFAETFYAELENVELGFSEIERWLFVVRIRLGIFRDFFLFPDFLLLLLKRKSNYDKNEKKIATCFLLLDFFVIEESHFSAAFYYEIQRYFDPRFYELVLAIPFYFIVKNVFYFK